MKRINKFLLLFIKLIGVIVLILLTGITAAAIFFAGRFALDNAQNTYSFRLSEQDRLVQGIYIPSKQRKSTDKIRISIEGETHQDCQFILTTLNPGHTDKEQYAFTRKFLLPKGTVSARNISYDSYNDENVSIVIRAAENEQNPMGNLKVTVKYGASLFDLLFL